MIFFDTQCVQVEVNFNCRFTNGKVTLGNNTDLYHKITSGDPVYQQLAE